MQIVAPVHYATSPVMNRLHVGERWKGELGFSAGRWAFWYERLGKLLRKTKLAEALLWGRLAHQHMWDVEHALRPALAVVSNGDPRPADAGPAPQSTQLDSSGRTKEQQAETEYALRARIMQLENALDQEKLYRRNDARVHLDQLADARKQSIINNRVFARRQEIAFLLSSAGWPVDSNSTVNGMENNVLTLVTMTRRRQLDMVELRQRSVVKSRESFHRGQMAAFEISNPVLRRPFDSASDADRTTRTAAVLQSLNVGSLLPKTILDRYRDLLDRERGILRLLAANERLSPPGQGGQPQSMQTFGPAPPLNGPIPTGSMSNRPHHGAAMPQKRYDDPTAVQMQQNMFEDRIVLFNEFVQHQQALCQRDQFVAIIIQRCNDMLNMAQSGPHPPSLADLLQNLPRLQDLPLCRVGMGCTQGAAHFELQLRGPAGRLIAANNTVNPGIIGPVGDGMGVPPSAGSAVLAGDGSAALAGGFGVAAGDGFAVPAGGFAAPADDGMQVPAGGFGVPPGDSFGVSAAGGFAVPAANGFAPVLATVDENAADDSSNKRGYPEEPGYSSDSSKRVRFSEE
ncbi:hypothetical protein ACHAQH_006792 [Verticillium albo-atrum]